MSNVNCCMLDSCVRQVNCILVGETDVYSFITCNVMIIKAASIIRQQFSIKQKDKGVSH